MRRNRSLSFVVPALVIAAAACSTRDAPQPEPGPAPPALPPLVDRSDGIGELALGATLAGSALETVTEGAWTTRRVAGSGADAEHSPAEGMKRAPGRASGSLGGPSTGSGDGRGRDGGPADHSEAGGEVAESEMGPEWAGAPADGDAGDAGTGEVRGAPEAPGVERKSWRGDKDALRLAAKESMRSAEPSVDAPAQQLRAGKTDDNADYQAYLEFLATWVDRKDIQSLYQPTDVSGRRFLRVTDASGRPVPGAIVTVVDEAADRVLWRGTSYGDGVVAYYPNLVPGARAEPGAPLLVEAYVREGGGEGPTGVRVEWDGVGETLELQLTETVQAPDPISLDVCFVIDTTGSMSDEIASIKASLLRVTEQLRGLGREFDLRYSAVLYRDLGDDYVTATHPFTADITAFDAALRDVRAAGGGDSPESLNQALAQAVDGVDWRPGAAKVAFLVADAAPHMDYDGDVPYGDGARAALAKGIRVHAVAASGLSAVGTLAFRQIAQIARGKFVFIEYGSAATSAESHGVAGKVESDNLEDILFEQIRDELATFGRAR